MCHLSGQAPTGSGLLANLEKLSSQLWPSEAGDALNKEAEAEALWAGVALICHKMPARQGDDDTAAQESGVATRLHPRAPPAEAKLRTTGSREAPQVSFAP